MKKDDKYKKTVIFGDLHVPHQDKTAVKLLLNFMDWYKPEIVIINGDLIDFGNISKFLRDPTTTPSIKEEIEEAKKVLKEVIEHSPKAKRYYIQGNHELRLQKYLITKAPEILELVNFEDLLEIKDKFEMVNDSLKENYIKIGSIYVGHWDRVSKFSAYTVKNIMADRGVSIVQSHVHRMGYHCERLMDRMIEGWEIGCLCSLNPSYVVSPNWEHGFGVIEPLAGGKFYHFQLVSIIDLGKKLSLRFWNKTFTVEKENKNEEVKGKK